MAASSNPNHQHPSCNYGRVVNTLYLTSIAAPQVLITVVPCALPLRRTIGCLSGQTMLCLKPMRGIILGSIGCRLDVSRVSVQHCSKGHPCTVSLPIVSRTHNGTHITLATETLEHIPSTGTCIPSGIRYEGGIGPASPSGPSRPAGPMPQTVGLCRTVTGNAHHLAPSVCVATGPRKYEHANHWGNPYDGPPYMDGWDEA